MVNDMEADILTFSGYASTSAALHTCGEHRSAGDQGSDRRRMLVCVIYGPVDTGALVKMQVPSACPSSRLFGRIA